MRRFIFCAAAILALSATQVVFAQDLCAKVFGESWRESTDRFLLDSAGEFIVKLPAPVSYVPFLCVGGAEPATPAMTRTPFEEFPEALFVAADSRFQRTYGKLLRVIIAHEIAHYGTVEGKACWIFSRERFAEYLACEADVDKLAAEWTGKMEMADALRAVKYFLESQPKSEVDPATFKLIDERIKLLLK